MTLEEAAALGWKVWRQDVDDSEPGKRLAGLTDDNLEHWYAERMPGPVRHSARSLEQVLEQIAGWEALQASRTTPAPRAVQVREIRPGGRS